MAQDAFVDVAYRGLEVGRRLKLRDVGPRTGYVEVGTPMPVGAPLTIESGGHSITAVVIRVHEQVAGADMPPGMRVRIDPIDGEAAGWWQALVSRDDPEIPEAERVIAPPEPAPAPAEISAGDSRSDVPQARDTAVMNVDEVAAAVAEAERDAAAGRSGNGVSGADAPDARGSGRTMVMSAVEIEQITGLALGDQGDEPDGADAAGDADDPAASGELAVQGEGEPSGSNGDELQGRGRGKRRRRKR